MTRRGLILAVLDGSLCFPLWADDAADVWDLLSHVAGALSEGNVVEFLKAFDHSMPGYSTLEANVTALVRDYQVGSSIEPITEEGNSRARTLDLDWFLELVEQEDNTNVTRRREKVRCRVAKMGKKWKIVSLEPLAFFAPPEEK
jgi:hypothetical protein